MARVCLPSAMNRSLLVAFLLLIVLVLLGSELAIGSVRLPLKTVLHVLLGGAPVEEGTAMIVRGIRLPQGLTALLAGMGLAVGGLMMQTVFRNPLAGPSVMGVSSGASMGVSLVFLARPVWMMLGLPVDLALIVAALIGSIVVLFLVVAADRRIGDGVTLLIVGLLIGYLCSAVISVLESIGTSTGVHGFVLWGMGSFSGVGNDRLPWLALPVMAGLVFAGLSSKPLNALLLGDDYARTLGVNATAVRRRMLIVTGLLAGTVTAFCGPIAFVGLITPHMARALARSTDHASLIPITALIGGALALVCDLLARAGLFGAQLPLNAVASLLGVPVVAWILLSGKRWARMA